MTALDEEMIYRVAGTNHESTSSQITHMTDVSKMRITGTEGSNDQFQLLATRSQSEYFQVSQNLEQEPTKKCNILDW